MTTAEFVPTEEELRAAEARRAQHARAGCDESCHCCVKCYQHNGTEICDRLCRHAVDHDFAYGRE